VTPIGFGRDITEASLFQDLLREGAVDILRPDLQRSGIPVIRRIAAMAETYYTAVAPNHHGGPVGTAVAIQLAASLPNFFIQHVPFPAAEQDRRMRAELVSAEIETVRDGFLGLPTAAGLGIQVNEAALEKYKDGNA
jgi:galactonate dehydratase